MDTITPKQLAFIESLLTDREWHSEKGRTIEQVKAQAAGLDKRQASKWIEVLLAKPKKVAPAAVSEAAGVPAGRYAVTEGTHLNFFLVEVPTRGRHVGRTFVKQIVAGNPGWNLRDDRKAIVLQLILAVGVEKAARAYGHHFGHCGFCRHDLTDKFSRFFGIGPVCRQRHGYPISEAAYRRTATPAQIVEIDEWIAEDQVVAEAKAAAAEDHDYSM